MQNSAAFSHGVGRAHRPDGEDEVTRGDASRARIGEDGLLLRRAERPARDAIPTFGWFLIDYSKRSRETQTEAFRARTKPEKVS